MIGEWLLRWADAVVTAQAPTRSRSVRVMLRQRRTFDRVASAFALVDRARPGAARALARHLYGPERLALATSAVEFLDYGSGGTVFLVRTPAGARVLKVYRRSLGRPLAEQLAIARYYAARYRTVAGWYAATPALLTPSAFAVLPGPVLGQPAAAAIQRFVAGARIDFFADQDEVTALARLRADESLASVFRSFADRTLALYAQGERCLDLVGRENLMLVDQGDRFRLAIVDFGIFELPALRREAPARFAALAQRIDRLDALRRRLG